MNTKLGTFIVDILQTVGLAVGLFILIYALLLQPHEVRGESMLPNFEDREHLFTDKLSYRLGDPKRGDVVVFASPPNPSEDYIKRLIGLPGETVTLKDNRVYINGNALNENYIPQDFRTAGGVYTPEGIEIALAMDEYFVLGDNRENSSDSRRWGPVKRKKLVGKAWIVYWPFSKVRVVRHATY